MKQSISLLVLLLSLIFYSSCNDDDVDPGSETIIKETVAGIVQKGPFLNGTAISVSELDNELVQSGNTFNTTIINNSGSFELQNLTLSSPFVQIQANGFYFNEITGENSTAPIILFALSDISNKDQVNVNVMTHLEKGRIEQLIDNGLTFQVAKDSAQQELLSVFGLSNQNISDSEELDISVNNAENAILIAISVILQSGNTVSDLSELLANISTDFRQNGMLDNEAIKSGLYNEALGLDLVAIRENIEGKYEELELTVTIPDFESVISQYIANLQPFDIDVVSNNVSCNAANDGSIDITINEGTSPFTYEWSNGATTEDLSSIGPGNYSVTIIDANGYRMGVMNIAITEPSTLTGSLTSGNISGIGQADGTASVIVEGGTTPYSYSWSDNSTTPSLTNLEKGIYTLTVTDANQCELTFETTIQEPVEIEFSKQDVSCFGGDDGAITTTISGGLAPYTIEWSNGSQVADPTNLTAQTYSVTITDQLGFAVNGSVDISQPEKLALNPSIVNPTLSSQGAVSLNVSGGKSPYTYSWSNNSTSSASGAFNNDEIFNLSVTVTDASGCTADSSFTITNIFTDVRDGQEYSYVKIGDQFWMAQDLNYENTGNNFIQPNGFKGRLYSYPSTEGACPAGWHISTDEEWTELEDFVVANDQIINLHETEFGSVSCEVSNNRFNFSLLPSGWWAFQGSAKPSYLNSFELSRYWTLSENELISRGIGACGSNISRVNYGALPNSEGDMIGFSVRCVKD
ncbi:MAG: FISUMP domain-containing protein [Cyclobacteriaceae bacterium]